VSEFGTFDWSDICAPAIADAKVGFVVRPHVYYWWTSGSDFGRVNVTDRLRFSKTGAKAYFREDGSVKRVGDRVVNPDLATTLERIAEYGPDIFYSGEIAEQIAADFASHGGLLTLADLKGYATRRIDPIAFDYRGYSLTTNHPPGGGIMVTQMLNTLEHFDLVELGHNSAEYIRVVSEAMKAATADRAPDFKSLCSAAGATNQSRRSLPCRPYWHARTQTHDTRGSDRWRRQCCHDDSFTRHALGRHH
jgi:gamma-glutamyltranspeptidase/glutathione hydrolase